MTLKHGFEHHIIVRLVNIWLTDMHFLYLENLNKYKKLIYFCQITSVIKSDLIKIITT